MPYNEPKKQTIDGYILVFHLMRHAAYDLGKQGRDKTYLVFIIIASHTDKEGVCWPSITKIAKQLRLTRQAVSQHVKILRDQKYLFVTFPDKNEYKKRTNLYQLNFAKLKDAPASSLSCGGTQAIEVAAPANSGTCPKKLEKKPERRKHFLDGFNKKKRSSHY